MTAHATICSVDETADLSHAVTISTPTSASATAPDVKRGVNGFCEGFYSTMSYGEHYRFEFTLQ